MSTVIDVKVASFEGKFSLELIRNLLQQKQEFKLCYYVVADNFSQDPIAIAGTPGLPTLGQKVYNAYCAHVEPKATDTVIHFLTGALTQLWEVEVTFSTMMRDPNDTTPEVDWGGEFDKENLEFDLYTGAKPTTTAGEPLFIERQVPQLILKIRRQEAYPFDPGTAALYGGKLNDTPFWGFPRGTCMMMPILVREDTQESQRVCWVDYEIKIKLTWNYDGTLQQDSWQAHILNQGHYFRPGIGKSPQVAKDKNNTPIVVNLDLYGQRLQDQNGTQLFAVGPPSTSLNRFVGMDFSDPDPFQAGPPAVNFVHPNLSDVGSSVIITSSTGGWNPGIYLISGVGTVPGFGGHLFWFLSGNPCTGTPTLGIWQIQRAPQYLGFNRAYYIDFNGLSLGPF